MCLNCLVEKVGFGITTQNVVYKDDVGQLWIGIPQRIHSELGLEEQRFQVGIRGFDVCGIEIHLGCVLGGIGIVTIQQMTK